ncbi:hypothetical Protein pso3_07340 [Candidatus Phytoplasma solani]
MVFFLIGLVLVGFLEFTPSRLLSWFGLGDAIFICFDCYR